MSDFLTTVLGAGLGSGLLLAAFTAWQTSKENRTTRRADFLFRQLQELYGPLHFLCGQNSKMCDHSGVIDNAIQSEIIDVKWSEQESTQQSIQQQLNDAIGVNNEYCALIRANNHRMGEIIAEHCHLMNQVDADAFQEFVLNSVRDRVELRDSKSKLPSRIYRKVGPLFFYDPSFPQLMRKRFIEISDELKQLHTNKELQLKAPPFRDIER